MEYILETNRLKIRKMTINDFEDIYNIMSDIEIMYAWENPFSKDEVINFINENIRRYKDDGYSYYVVLRKEDNLFLGLAGIISEKVEEEKYIGVGYIFDKKYWNKGYAIEAITGLEKYGYEKLKLRDLTAQIRPSNLASIKLAEKIGMKPIKEFEKIYKGKKMKHILYWKDNTIK